MLASIFGQLGHPIFAVFAWMLASFYALVPNFAIAIALLTLAVMTVLSPITVRATRGMLRLQLLAPEMKSLQARFAAEPGSSPEDRQALRLAQQRELKRVYDEHEVSPIGGCLPMILQLPVFLVLYETIRGLVHTALVHGVVVPDPLYISRASKLYLAIEHAHGQLASFGLNLADTLRTGGLSWGARLPLAAIVVVAVGLQWLQIARSSGRGTDAAASDSASHQAQRIQKALSIVFAFIYVSVPAGVNLYLVISGLIRIAQQELIHRFDPDVRALLRARPARTNPA
jgi:YidC/Oxa1 family membrane protein insertase